MIRLLHLIDAAADEPAHRSAAWLSRRLGDGFAARTQVIGAGGDHRGILAAARAIRRADVDLVHCWGGRALAAGVLGARTPLIHSPASPLTRRGIGWMRAVMSHRNPRIVVTSTTAHHMLVGQGIPADRCQIIRPGVEFARIGRRRDLDLRRALGIADDDYVLVAVGQSTSAANHRDSVWVAGILHVLDPRYRILYQGDGPLADAASAFALRLGLPKLAISARQALGRPVDLEQILPAGDMVLINASAPIPPLPVCIAMASGLPIISTVTPTVSELIEDRHTAVFVPSTAPRLMAQRILEVRADADLRQRITDRARAEAYEFFALSRFMDDYRSLYVKVSNEAACRQPRQNVISLPTFPGTPRD